MPEKIIQSRIQFLNDTAEALAAQGESIPKKGEPVYENDTRKLKVGGTALDIADKAVDITAISTDLLTQGTMTLVLNGGNAATLAAK